MQAQAAFGGAQSPSAGVPSGWQPARSVSPRGNQRDVSPGRSAGRASGAHFHQPAGESVGSLVFGGGGGGHVPVLNGGGHSRANSMAGARSAMSRAAGAAIEEQSRSRAVAEKNFDRRMKGQPRSLDAQYDAYLDAVEDHTFAKLNAQLGKMERKAEREHNMMNGAAGGGMSTEARNARADARMEGRRSKSPGDLFRRASPSRFHDASGGSVASLLQQPDAAVRHGTTPRGPPSPRFGGEHEWQQQQQQQQQQRGRPQSPRRPSPGYQQPQRSSSPRPFVPRIPAERVPSAAAPGDESYRSDRQWQPQQQQRPGTAESYHQQMRHAESPRGARAASPRRAPSPRPQRAQSPFRQRPQ